MAKEPLAMRKIQSVLELHCTQGLSIRKTARSLGLERSTVSDYLSRAAAAGVGWPLPSNWNEGDLHRAPFDPGHALPARALPNWAYVHGELHTKAVTLQLLHEQRRTQTSAPAGRVRRAGPAVRQGVGVTPGRGRVRLVWSGDSPGAIARPQETPTARRPTRSGGACWVRQTATGVAAHPVGRVSRPTKSTADTAVVLKRGAQRGCVW